MSNEIRPKDRAIADVVSLDDRRGDAVASVGMVCPECGDAWFKVEGIVLDEYWHVTGYTYPITCAGCGHVM